MCLNGKIVPKKRKSRKKRFLIKKKIRMSITTVN